MVLFGWGDLDPDLDFGGRLAGPRMGGVDNEGGCDA